MMKYLKLLSFYQYFQMIPMFSYTILNDNILCYIICFILKFLSRMIVKGKQNKT